MANMNKLKGLVVMSAAVAVTHAGRAAGRWRTSWAAAFSTVGARQQRSGANLRSGSSAAGALASASASAPKACGLDARLAAPLAAGAAVGAAARLLAAGRRRSQPCAARCVATKAEGEQSAVSLIDFRVGEIVSCEKHPESEKLLVEMIDVGEGAPRQICSGISEYYSPEDIVGRRVVIVANLKERRMAGTPSNGMVLCATKGEEGDRKLELVEAPEAAEIGERIVIEIDGQVHGDAAPPNRVQKKKLYEKVAPELCTDSEGTVCYMKSPFATSAGPCTAKSLADAVVS